MDSSSKDDLSKDWIVCDSKSVRGRKYYFNRRSGQSSWTRPQEDNHTVVDSKIKQEKDIDKQRNLKRKSEDWSHKDVDNSSQKKIKCTTGTTTTMAPTNITPKTPTKRRNAEVTKKAPTKISEIAEVNYSVLKIPLVGRNIPQGCSSTTPQPKHKLWTENLYKNPPGSVIPLGKITKKKKNEKFAKNIANNRLAKLRAEQEQDRISQSTPSSSNQHQIQSRPCNTTINNVQTAVSNKNVIKNINNNKKPKQTCPQNQNRVNLQINPNISKSTSQKPQNVELSTSNESLHSIPSPSQFFAANKILSSMKAQLPEEYTNKIKGKNAFAVIEEGICNQMSDYSVNKHPVTPPQFSEASKIVSAMKSKLERKLYTSASDRLQSLRKSLNEEVLHRTKHVPEKNVLNVSDSVVYNVNKRVPEENMDIDVIQNEALPKKLIQGQSQPKNLSVQVANFKKNVELMKDLVLVVDTNVFIHELGLIRKVLNSHIMGYADQPTLLVPWRVINELDRLKDNNNGTGAVCKRAKAAMDYLYQSLPENHKIKGQTLRDANSHIYPCEIPDDEILNCCLQQAERGKSVILLSNDKNLCNKAVINNIRSIGVSELNELLEDRAPVSSDSDLESSLKYYESCIHQLLANILENETRIQFTNKWDRMIHTPPPWSLMDVLVCLLHHWIAVFDEVFPRIEHLLQELKNTLSVIVDKGPKRLTQSLVTNFKELALEVASKCQIIPEYMQLAKTTVERLNHKTEQNECVINDNVQNNDMIVIEAFENIWTVFSSYCAKLATHLNISHTLEDKLASDDSMELLRSKWPVFSRQIHLFSIAVNGILSVNPLDSNFNEQMVNLEIVFRESLTLISLENRVNRPNLINFCINNRNMLQEAGTKFVQLTELLDLCSRLLVSDTS